MKLVAVVALVAVAVLSVSYKSIADNKAVDEHGDKAMESKNKAEAREWFKSPSHVLFKEDRKEVMKFVEDFYKAGSKKVMIVDIESHDGKDFAGGLLVVLPKDQAARKKVFEVGGKADEAFQNDPTTDEGQKYLYYTFD